MSHYVDIKTEIRDAYALVRTLRRIGFDGFIDVYESARPLTDFFGNKTGLMGEIIIRRGSVGNYADIGFERTGDGTYRIHVDAYDSDKARGGKFTAEWQNRLFTYYGVEKAKIELDKREMRYVEDTDELQRPRLRVFV